jgi:hypothetical protein
MQPLSNLVRRIYFAIFFVLFLVCIPVAIFFASGYRFSPDFGIFRTGGIYLSVPYNDAIVYVNGEEVGRSGILNRGFYIDSLSPDAYEIRVERKGSLPWYRTLIVEPEVVTDARAVLIPEAIDVFPLTFLSTTSTSTRPITRAQYDAYLDAFETGLASTTVGREGETLFVDTGDVYVRLLNESTIPSSRFCGRPSYCVRHIAVEETRQKATGAFYIGDNVVYITEEGGVFFAEPDVRPTSVMASLYARRGADARLIDGRLIIKDGDDLYEIDGL